jgi:large subunit ribosomal protein L3
MKMLVGRKIQMTQISNSDGSVAPVTMVKVGAGVVIQIKTVAKDGYTAVQLGFNESGKHVSKSVAGHVKGALERPKLRELRLDDVSGFNVGDKYDAGLFTPGDKVVVTGVSKGKGFAGVVKRHHFHGSPKTHGHKHDLRAGGSIGPTDPQRVLPGVRMPGRMGGEQVTVLNQTIAKVDVEQGVLYVKGAVPGARNGLVIIKGEN